MMNLSAINFMNEKKNDKLLGVNCLGMGNTK